MHTTNIDKPLKKIFHTKILRKKMKKIIQVFNTFIYDETLL